MYRTAVMGDRDSIYGFASVGFDIFPIDDPQQAAHSLKKMVEGGYGVIYITESLASQIEVEIDKYRENSLPAIIPIPGITGNTGIGMKNVSKCVEQAVGSDILSGT